MNNFFFLFLVFCCIALRDHVQALNCYIDSKGIRAPEIGQVIDKSSFRTLQCNILKEEIEKVQF